jgi:hypothetical protein
MAATLLVAGGASSAGTAVTAPWRADAERPIAEQWASIATEDHCAVVAASLRADARVMRVRSPRAQGAYAYAFHVRDGDRCYGERAELGQALPSRSGFTAPRLFREGDDRWISFVVLLGLDFPVHTSHWNLIAQWKQLAVPNRAGCCPVLALEVHDGRYHLDHEGRNLWTGPQAVRGRWTRLTLHVHFSADPALGSVEMFGAGGRRLMRPKRISTLALGTDGAPVPSAARIGIYRDPAIPGDAHDYFDDYTVQDRGARSRLDAGSARGR